MADAVTSSVPAVKDALLAGLSKVSGLAGVEVYTAGLADASRVEECIVFGQVTVDDLQAGIGMTDMFEEYSIAGAIRVRRPGAGEAAAKSARDRLFTILGYLQEYLADHPTLSVDGVKSVEFKGFELDEWAEDRERWAGLRFRLDVRAQISPT